MRSIVPIANLQRRIPEAGRIRTGAKTQMSNGKERPTALPEFRFTSHDAEALNQIAAMYGGTVLPWSDPKAAEGQFEVRTTATEIRVVLPPDPLGSTPIYELWGGGGCERRCDGLTASVLTKGPDGLEPTEVGCLCQSKGEMSCKVVTRLNVILPEVRFAGVWRLDTHSWNAAQELPGMVDMVQTMQGSGLSYATLALKNRRSTQGGQTKKFIVPMLGIPESVEALAAGAAQLGSLPPSTPPLVAELAPVEESEIVDAELVDEASGLSGEGLRDLVKDLGIPSIEAIRAAHGFAESLGLDLPPNLTSIEDPALSAALERWARSAVA